MLPRRCTSNIPSRNPSSDLSHLGRADAPKKMRICRVTERLPRIARLPHLKTQTPRTPRAPRVKSSTTTAENKRVGRRWSPPGGLQYFLCRRPRTKLQQQVGRRLEQRWPYYFFYGRLIRQHQGGEGGGRRGGGEGGGGGGSGTTLKSYNPNTEGGEKNEN